MNEFREVQKFSQWWIWLILIAIGFIPIYGIYKQLILGEIFGDKPMSDLGLILFAFSTFAIIALFYIIQLKTEINKFEIQFSFYPFIKKKIKWVDVKSANIVTYGLVGYGIRFGTKYGTVYNIKGNKGLAIELKSGKKFLIGTQKHLELSEISKFILKKLNEKSIEY